MSAPAETPPCWAKVDAQGRVISHGIGQAGHFDDQLRLIGAVPITAAQRSQLLGGGNWVLTDGALTDGALTEGQKIEGQQ